jgi:hypothetical protein
MERAFFAGDALHNKARRFIDENAHENQNSEIRDQKSE